MDSTDVNCYWGFAHKALDYAFANERSNFIKEIDRFNGFCRRNNLQPIIHPDILFEYLIGSPKRRSYYRQRINFYLKKKTIVPLQSVEQDFIEGRRPHS